MTAKLIYDGLISSHHKLINLQRPNSNHHKLTIIYDGWRLVLINKLIYEGAVITVVGYVTVYHTPTSPNLTPTHPTPSPPLLALRLAAYVPHHTTPVPALQHVTPSLPQFSAGEEVNPLLCRHFGPPPSPASACERTWARGSVTKAVTPQLPNRKEGIGDPPPHPQVQRPRGPRALRPTFSHSY
jgi:hypothetical protein